VLAFPDIGMNVMLYFARVKGSKNYYSWTVLTLEKEEFLYPSAFADESTLFLNTPDTNPLIQRHPRKCISSTASPL
jgi:hypothetical protein